MDGDHQSGGGVEDVVNLVLVIAVVPGHARGEVGRGFGGSAVLPLRRAGPHRPRLPLRQRRTGGSEVRGQREGACSRDSTFQVITQNENAPFFGI